MYAPKAKTHCSTNRCDTSRQQVPWSALLLRQGCLCGFCHCNMSHQFKPVWICATDHSNKILSQWHLFSNVTQGDLLQQSVVPMCHGNLSHSVSRPRGVSCNVHVLVMSIFSNCSLPWEVKLGAQLRNVLYICAVQCLSYNLSLRKSQIETKWPNKLRRTLLLCFSLVFIKQ